MEKKLIEYLKKYCEDKQKGQADKGYANCCADILQIIDVAKSMFGTEKPRRNRRTKAEIESSKKESEIVTGKAWRCKKGHYFDFPKEGKSGAKLCVVCLTKDIEHNPHFKA